jgi:hypothetical protein
MSQFGRTADTVSAVVGTLLTEADEDDRTLVFERLMQDRALFIIVQALMEWALDDDDE